MCQLIVYEIHSISELWIIHSSHRSCKQNANAFDYEAHDLLWSWTDLVQIWQYDLQLAAVQG